MASNTDPIILKLELQEAQAKVNIKKLKQELDRLDGRTNEYKLSVKKLQVEEQKLVKIQGDRVTQNKVLSGSLGNLTKGMHGADKATGAATTSVLELGRVVSDAPYGIRGMANNVSQLASNMLFGAQQIDKATGKAVGFTGVIKGMGKAFAGPLGLLFAIQAVIAAVDFFAGGMKKAENAINILKDGFKKVAGNTAKAASDLKILRKALQDGTISTEESNRAIAKANKQYEGLNLKLDENNRLTSDSVDRINEKIDALERLAKANAIQSLIEEEYSKIASARAALDLEVTKNGFKLKEVEAKKAELEAKLDGVRGRARSKIQEQFFKDNFKKNQRATFNLLSDFNKIEKAGKETIKSLMSVLSGESLFDELFKEPKGSGSKGRKISPFKVGKELDIDIKSNEAALLSYSNKIAVQDLKNAQAKELLDAKTEQQKDLIKKDYQRKFLILELDNELKTLTLRKDTEKAVMKVKYDNFQREAQLRFLAYVDTIDKNDKLTELQKKAAKDSARADTGILSDNAFKEFLKSNKEIDASYEPLFELYRDLRKARLDSLGITEDGVVKEKEFDAISHYINTYKTLMSGVTEFINGESERQLTIEQNKTNALNEQLNNRLLNENLSKEERAGIQNEIWQNDEKLRVKQEKIAKKKFNTAKAFNMVMAAADTYGAANKALNDPTPMPTFARFALATATVVSGLANVAAIARQKFQSTSAATPPRTAGSGGSGSGVGDREFNFNLVGNTQTNQLAEAIQGQFSQPLKAFVVSKDVTTQQELDANIKGTATF